MVTRTQIARYIIESPYAMYHNGYYYVRWSKDYGLNYYKDIDRNNIYVLIPFYDSEYDDERVYWELEYIEDFENEEFMAMCDKLADELNREIKKFERGER